MNGWRSIGLAMVLVAIGWPAMFGWSAGQWKALNDDGLHDPEGPSIGDLQQPQEALSALPADTAGNNVRWVEALRQGAIQPRTNIHPSTEIRVLDLDIIYDKVGNYPLVRFPHRPHTEWLDCSNCHDEIFKPKFRETKFTMMQILQGEYCGRCHGAVAFPLTECNRCHSVDPFAFNGQVGPQGKVPPEAYKMVKTTPKSGAKR